MTGHLSCTYMIAPIPSTRLSTRFEFNFFNHESALAMGLDHCKDQNTLIRTSIDAESRLSLYLEKKLKQIRLAATIGVSCFTRTDSNAPSIGLHVLYQP